MCICVRWRVWAKGRRLFVYISKLKIASILFQLPQTNLPMDYRFWIFELGKFCNRNQNEILAIVNSFLVEFPIYYFIKQVKVFFIVVSRLSLQFGERTKLNLNDWHTTATSTSCLETHFIAILIFWFIWLLRCYLFYFSLKVSFFICILQCVRAFLWMRLAVILKWFIIVVGVFRKILCFIFISFTSCIVYVFFK